MINQTVVSAVKYVMPHGLVQQVFRSKAVIRRRLNAHNAAHTLVARKYAPYSYEAAIEFHCARGLNRGQLIGGSMPEASLDFCSKTLDELIPDDRPLVGLHVGNFLGVSLSYFGDYVSRRKAKSVVISIDPNIQHQGSNPRKTMS
jgi:hypothetical protein